MVWWVRKVGEMRVCSSSGIAMQNWPAEVAFVSNCGHYLGHVAGKKYANKAAHLNVPQGKSLLQVNPQFLFVSRQTDNYLDSHPQHIMQRRWLWELLQSKNAEVFLHLGQTKVTSRSYPKKTNKQTNKKTYQSLFVTGLRPPLQTDLGPVVLVHTRVWFVFTPTQMNRIRPSSANLHAGWHCPVCREK